MEIALFSDGVTAVIGIRKSDGRIDYQKYEAAILFQDPELLPERFLVLLERSFGITNTNSIQQFTLGLPGYIDSKNGVIELSNNLDELTIVKSYKGYHIRNIFKKYFKNASVNLLNDAAAIGHGVLNVYKDFKPALIISIDKSVGASIIDKFGIIHSTELGSWYLFKHGTGVDLLLSRRKIESLVSSGSTDIHYDYTSTFIDVIAHFREGSGKLLNKISKGITILYLSLVNTESVFKEQHLNILKEIPHDKIFIWSSIEEYLDKKMLNEAKLNDVLFFPQNEVVKYRIPIIGCLEYYKYLSLQKPKVKKIEYFAAGKIQLEFKTFTDFLNHWNDIYTFANPENSYSVYYDNGIEKIIKMRELKYLHQLEEYKF